MGWGIKKSFRRVGAAFGSSDCARTLRLRESYNEYVSLRGRGQKAENLKDYLVSEGADGIKLLERAYEKIGAGLPKL